MSPLLLGAAGHPLPPKRWIIVATPIYLIVIKHIAISRQHCYYNNIPYWIDSTLKKLSIDDATASTVNIQTGKISCGDLSKYKKFVKALVTIDDGDEFAIYYKIDSGGWSDAILLTNGISDVSIGQKGKTIQFKIVSDAGTDSTAEISDITLVYRDLRID